MRNSNRATGSSYEKKAAAYLVEKGYLIKAMNYGCRTGEIDIIAQDNDTLVFCEVKYRSSAVYGYPEEAVNPLKQHRIRKTAEYYLLSKRIPESQEIRFDVITFLAGQINHIKDAF